MRVLMFGWEFPPFQAGGLATATVGLVKGLLRQGVEVTLVVPFPVDQSPLAGLRMLGVEEPAEGQLVVHRIPSPMQPYGSAQQYTEIYAESTRKSGNRNVYGPNLFADFGYSTFWQYTDLGLVTGIKGRVDASWFHGTQTQLNSLAYVYSPASAKSARSVLDTILPATSPGSGGASAS